MAKIKEVKSVTIKAPDIRILVLKVRGETPLVMHRFGAKAKMIADQSVGSKVKSKNREPKDWDELYEQAAHKFDDGSGYGIPCAAFRNSAIRACSLVGMPMTMAKMSIWFKSDGNSTDGSPLVRLYGEPEKHFGEARNANGGVDIRIRPMFRKWTATLKVCYDADQFSADDVANIVLRSGLQVGILEGRMSSKNSAGMGWGSFVFDTDDEDKQAAE